MVVIRLCRGGTTHTPKYRVTVADSRRSRNGKYLENVGYYNPNPQGNDKKYDIKLDRIQEWISKGAQPSDRVKHIIKLAQETN